MTKYMVYCHSAVPQNGIKMNTWYALDELVEKFDMDYINTFFTPANFSESEINSKKQVKGNK